MTTGTQAFAQLDADNPWPGLDAFDESAHHFFFGRGTEGATLLRSVLDAPVTVLYGRSGLGKTSLLQASLFPALRARHFLPIYIRLDLTPEAPEIAHQLRQCVRGAVEEASPGAALPADSEDVWEYLHRTDVELWSSRNYLLTPILVIDQFEELFTVGQQVPELVRDFRHDLGDLVENRIPDSLMSRLEHGENASTGLALRSRGYKLLICLREDFLPDLEGWQQLIPMLGRSRLRLLPMDTDAALEAVEKPAAHLMTGTQAQQVVRFIAGENVAHDGDGDSRRRTLRHPTELHVEPALLSLFCRELNEARKRRSASQFDEQLIEGAQRDVLKNYYEMCVANLPVRVAHFIEDQLITRSGFRNSYACEDAVPSRVTEAELDQLVRSRLVRIEDRYGTQRIELSHDVLTHVIRERRDQRKAEHERASLAAQLEAASRRQSELDQQRIHERQRRLQSEREKRRLRWLSVALAALLLVSSALAVTSYVFSRDAQSQRALAFSSSMAGQAEQLVDQQPQLAMMLGLESLSAARNVTAIPPNALITAMARVTHPSRQLIGHTGYVTKVAFSPDGKLLASASTDGTLRLWETTTGKPHGLPLIGHTDFVNGVAFSPDGTLVVSASSDRTVRLWEVATGQQRGPPLIGHTGVVNAVAFSPDGALLASASADGTLRLWDTATGKADGPPLVGHTGVVSSVAFSPNGRLLASASADLTVRLWDTATGRSHGPPLVGHTGVVSSVAFSPNGQLLASASGDETIRLWDTATGKPHGSPLIGHTDFINAVAFSPNGQLLASASGDQTIRLWDTATGEPHGQALTGHASFVNGVAFSPDGALLASAGGDGTVRLWDTTEKYTISEPLTGHTSYVNGAAFSPDGALVASASADGTVRLWDAATGKPHGSPLTGNTSSVNGVAFSPDGALVASAGADGTVRLWDAATGKPHGPPLTGHTSYVNWVAFSPNGALLASASADLTVRLWDAATGKPHGPPLTGHTSFVSGVAFSPDGTLLASAADDRTVRLWDTATGKPHGPPLTGHTDYVKQVAFSHDGTLLASASVDRTIRLWDTTTGKAHGPPLAGHTDGINDVAFNSDDTQLVSASADHTVRLWNVKFTAWASAACQLVKENLSASQWAQYAPDQPYERTCPELPAGPGAPADAPAAEYPLSG